MILSDLSVKRPIVATVMSIVLVLCGLVAFQLLPLRQYPNIDPPIVSVETSYPGAAANVVERRITELIEERIAGVEGIESIGAVSVDGKSTVTVTFDTGQDIDAAANDVRDRVSGILDNLPIEADPPDISKVDSDQSVIMWLNFVGEGMTVPELTDYADRYLVDRFSALDGVARVRIGGQQSYAMRLWLDRKAMAARNITVSDIEARLRAENVDLPAGSVESSSRILTVRLDRTFQSEEDFAALVLAEGPDGYDLRIGDVARVELGTVEDRTFFRGNRVPQVGLGITRQSTANTVAVAKAAKAEAAAINPTLPAGMSIEQSYDTSVFIEGAINEVYKTLFLAITLVVFVIYVFLGSARAMLIPALTVPVSLVGAFFAMYLMDFSINLLTLLALVLAIGLVVDDAIVVLENIYRRMEEENETPLVAAYEGSRQVAFAVIATTVVLVSVFAPIAFLQGDIGRLFSEFALTIAAAVAISSFVALSLSPAIASKILKPQTYQSPSTKHLDRWFKSIQNNYSRLLQRLLRRPFWGMGVMLIGFLGTAGLFHALPSEYAPPEDRGAFFVIVNGPEGANHDYMSKYMDEIETRLMRYVENGEVQRLLVRAPRSFGSFESFNTGLVICVLNDWSERRSAFTIIDEIRSSLSDLPGIRAFPVMRQGFGGSLGKPIQMTIGGGDWETLTVWRDILLQEIENAKLPLTGLDWDYKETAPQLRVQIDYNRAAELGVPVADIGRTLETMLGSRRVTTFISRGEEYDVLLEGDRNVQRTPNDLTNLYVRSEKSTMLVPLSNLVNIRETGESSSLKRYNRVRAITLEANLPDGATLGPTLSKLEELTREVLPAEAIIDFKGQSLDYRQTGSSILFIFGFGVCIVFLVLAAQFESWRHPFVIMMSVPIAILGGLIALSIFGQSLNLYSQIGLLMLVGLAAKNGILIVEFANQLRDQGHDFNRALIEASQVRFRPIIMTGVTTVAGSIPLILSSGAGSETRFVIGIVVIGGVFASTIVTLFTVPVAYSMIARGTSSPSDIARRLELERAGTNSKAPAE
ncbi:MAG: efflux RND transporter permease subunit [Pseudomonadota bacterium]